MAMKEENVKLLLQKFIDALTNSEGAAWQMIHAHQEIRFVPVRDMLGQIKNSAIQIAIMP